MADPDTCVAYLVDSLYHRAGADVGLAPVARFLESYVAHDAGVSHRLLVLRRGFRTAQAWAPHASEFDNRGTGSPTDLSTLRLFYANRCAYCYKPLPDNELTWDHVTPVSRGGTNNPWDNLVPCCRHCNRRL